MKRLSVDVSHKHYPGSKRPVLENLSLHIDEGEFLAVVGPSGAGKTTLMNIVASLDREMQGKVALTDAVEEHSVILKPKIGYVFQSPRLIPWMTIADNLRLVMEGEPDADERIRTMLHAVGLAGSEDLFPGELSGGMQRRAGIARAFVVQPDILLLDEPFVSVDAPTAARLRELLISLWNLHRPMVMLISHVLKEAIAMADRIVFMGTNPGRVVYEMSVPCCTRPRLPDDPNVLAVHDQLLEEHPEILSGLVESSSGSSDKKPD